MGAGISFRRVPKEDLDSIQQEIFQYCNQIVPRYIPRMEIIDYQNSGIFLIYLWCSAGDSGPYQAPKTVYLEIDNIRRGYLEDFIKKSNSSLIEETITVRSKNYSLPKKSPMRQIQNWILEISGF